MTLNPVRFKMKPAYFAIGALYFLYILTDNPGHRVDAAEDNNTTMSFNMSQSYCFRFTWLGPEYDATTTISNTSCDEYLDDRRAVGVPCRQPMLITHDGTPPNITHLFTNETFRDRVMCRRARGQVCAKYSFTFNGALQNITYMCARAYAVDEGAVTSGCYKQSLGGHDVEVCICESDIGTRPCNGTSLAQVSVHLFGIILILLYFTIYR